jgi:hypothetical protein
MPAHAPKRHAVAQRLVPMLSMGASKAGYQKLTAHNAWPLAAPRKHAVLSLHVVAIITRDAELVKTSIEMPSVFQEHV